MNIERNDKLIQRNARIAQFTMFAGLLVLGAGMFVSFRYPEQVGLSLGALLMGFIFSQVGIYFLNRWGRKPRPDELIDKSLKGLDKKFTLYHYATPVSHLLVGPTGLWVLLPQYQRGTITYAKGRWRQKGGGILYQYLKIFAQEGLGRPDLEVKSEIESLEALLKKALPEESLPPIQAALVFTHAQAVIDIPKDETPPAETVAAGELKKLVTRATKGKSLSVEKARVIGDVLLAG
jgi:hypothetical protein